VNSLGRGVIQSDNLRVMKATNNPSDKYKKLNTRPPAKKTSSRGTDKNSRSTRQTLQESAKPGKSRKDQKGQVAVIIALSLFCISLIVLIIILLQPGKMQFWQSLPGREGDKTAVVKRLEPAEPVQNIPETIQEETVTAPVPETPPENAAAAGTDQTRETRVYFVKVNAEGLISLKSVSRNIDFSKSPLTQTINALIGGPLSDEINKGSLTLIPEGTRLLSARVEAGTAYLNFNEAFRFNPLGREGYLAQLKQIVYTSTEFPSIKNVQIMIEGVIREYLGGEGFYIGEPLSRDSFKNNT